MTDWRDWIGRVWVGDCLEFMRQMPDGCVDAVITDPPYGIARVWKGGQSHGWAAARLAAAQRNEWDSEAPSAGVFEEIRRVGLGICIWGGNHFPLPPSRGWLVWTKPERGFSLSEAELAWTDRDTVMRVFDGRRSDPDREHPTQKPLRLMEWCVDRLTEPGDTVFDPFLGSGTTAVACERLGRRWLGCEINGEYAALATKRIERERAQMKLFAGGTR